MGSRPYTSAVRRRQAEQTRTAVLEAAAGAFSDHGYAGATLAAIATRAGVSVETVKATGAKAELLLASFEHTFGGQAGDHPTDERIAERVARAPVDAEQFLGGLIDFVADGNDRASRLWLAFQGAASADPTVGAALADLLRRRDRDLLTTVREFARLGWQPRTGEEQTAAILGYLIAPESHLHFVHHGHWSLDDYRTWLASAVAGLFSQA